MFSTEEKDLDRTDYPAEKQRYLESLSFCLFAARVLQSPVCTEFLSCTECVSEFLWPPVSFFFGVDCFGCDD